MAKSPCPRTIFVRHGQTEWSKSGQYTSITDLPLTEFGVNQMRKTGKLLFSTGFIDPNHITYIFTSPRKRALQTVKLILESLDEETKKHIKIIVDNDLREWEYGDYEGLLTQQIKDLRKSRNLPIADDWLIWRDGCENGEATKQIGLRLSRFIARVQNLQKIAIEENKPCDILCFAHGHTLRYFASLWFKSNTKEELIDSTTPAYVKSYDDDTVPVVEIEKFRYLDQNPNFLLDAGGVGVLSYGHHDINEPSLSLSGAFVIPPEEESEHQ
ncbi:hypothetical protein WICMUC_002658 [Wickerhamomyces mucosus]|uniref:Sedoheptulose 1,7-bisphosphatase n=1 Tax=Wickerhamomyces mucosus TaxID=1378264 RepID=A0A9P8PQN5_9ASCO|nr:hypothetical protein WICMUC_002658 [Wickerhamomyces mucosus]